MQRILRCQWSLLALCKRHLAININKLLVLLAQGAGGIGGTTKLKMEDTLELLNAVPVVGAASKLAIKGGKKIVEKVGKAVAENK